MYSRSWFQFLLYELYPAMELIRIPIQIPFRKIIQIWIRMWTCKYDTNLLQQMNTDNLPVLMVIMMCLCLPLKWFAKASFLQFIDDPGSPSNKITEIISFHNAKRSLQGTPLGVLKRKSARPATPSGTARTLSRPPLFRSGNYHNFALVTFL